MIKVAFSVLNEIHTLYKKYNYKICYHCSGSSTILLPTLLSNASLDFRFERAFFITRLRFSTYGVKLGDVGCVVALGQIKLLI